MGNKGSKAGGKGDGRKRTEEGEHQADGGGGGYRHAHRKMVYRSERLEIAPEEKETLDRWLAASTASGSSAKKEAEGNEKEKEQESVTDDRKDACKVDVAENEKKEQEEEKEKEKEKVRNEAEEEKEDQSALNDQRMRERVKVIFDTDIGTDVDDALALLMLLHLPEGDVELLGITTTYGYTQVRAKVAQEIMTAYERGLVAVEKGDDTEAQTPPSRQSVPVIAGRGRELGTHRDVWHTGTEGMGLFTLEEIDKMMEDQKKQLAQQTKNEAAEFIVEQVLKYPNQVVLIGLGALTNIAEALELDPRVATSTKKLVYMGMGHRMKESQSQDFPFRSPTEEFEYGHVYHHYPNHNISSDTLAAVRVFAAEGLRIDVINDAVTNKIWWTGEPCLSLMHAIAPPESEVVGRLLKTWLYYRSAIFFREVRGTCPHDALTVAEAIYPDRFVQYARGHLMMHEWAGFSTFVLDDNGPHRIGVTVNSADFLTLLSACLTRGLVSRPTEDIIEEEETRKLEEIKMRTWLFKQ